MPTDMISEKWPHDGTYTDPALPLHIDIGCGKGGFLLSLAKSSLENNSDLDEKRNYLGLEIRPSVVKYAKDRIPKRKLDGIIDFVGCNANVDLDRLLYHYTMGKDGNNSGGGGELALVSIQFPDPHFKKQHQKRRVVTPELVQVLTKHVPVGRKVFIQSDIKDVLDNMRLTIREEGSGYFNDEIENIDEYMENNPTGVPTEREISVLEQDLPVYRTMFVRTDTEYNEKLEE
jgi:tRNA (guanine-N7-)-methyltransferase